MKPRKLCENCTHWVPSQFNNEKDTGNCHLAFNEGNELVENELMLSWDYEGYRSGLSTRKNFGCVCWAKKE